jgi:hypothetical protein
MRGFFDLVAVLAVTSLLGGAATRAHGGGLNAQGCHNDRKGGTGYHCHRSGLGPALGSGRSAPLGLLARSAGEARSATARRLGPRAPPRSAAAMPATEGISTAMATV